MSTRTERGSMSIEAVIVIPTFLLFLLLAAAIGRVAWAHQNLHAAVVAAARVTSQQTSPAAGDAQGRAHAASALAASGPTCVTTAITIDAAALAFPVGQPGLVTARIDCTVRLSDLTVPGLPGTMTLSETFSATIDPYAER